MINPKCAWRVHNWRPVWDFLWGAVFQLPMRSLPNCHTVLLRNDGTVVSGGRNEAGQRNIPPLEDGFRYIQASAGAAHTVLLRSDGHAVSCGRNAEEQGNIPSLDEGMSYTQVSAGFLHTVLLRSDGQAVACGGNADGQCNMPPLDNGMSYIQVSAGHSHTVLLQRDGNAVACGRNSEAQCKIPALDEGMSYTRVSAGADHTVFLRSDGHVVACGGNGFGQCSIPPLDVGISYTRLSAGFAHTVLIRSDGQAVSCGARFGAIPPLEEGVSYIDVSARGFHAELLRSDGCVVIFGRDDYGRDFHLPPPVPGTYYVFDPSGEDLVLQANFVQEDQTVTLICSTLAGKEVVRSHPEESDLVWETRKRLASELKVYLQNLKVLLTDSCWPQSADVADLNGTDRKRRCLESPLDEKKSRIALWTKVGRGKILLVGGRYAVVFPVQLRYNMADPDWAIARCRSSHLHPADGNLAILKGSVEF